jgi:hypothetical protein
LALILVMSTRRLTPSKIATPRSLAIFRFTFRRSTNIEISGKSALRQSADVGSNARGFASAKVNQRL